MSTDMPLNYFDEVRAYRATNMCSLQEAVRAVKLKRVRESIQQSTADTHLKEALSLILELIS